VIVVRIAKASLDSPLRAFHWIDSVGASTDQVQTMLRERIRRTDPTRPRFQPTPKTRIRDSDLAALHSVQDAVDRWRKQFGSQETTVQAMRDQIEGWRRTKDLRSDERLAEIFQMGNVVSGALRDLPVSQMTPALRYGLRANPMLVRHGTYLDVSPNPSWDDYKLECLNRVFDAALAIGRFDVSGMPRGFSEVPNAQLELPPTTALVYLLTDHRAEIQVFTLAPKLLWIGKLQAREHGASLLCASRGAGGLHAVGVDDDELLIWSGSHILPATTIRRTERVLAASMWDQEALLVDAAGRLFTVAPEGIAAELPGRVSPGQRWELAVLLRSSDDPGDAWVALTDKDKLVSHGTARAEHGCISVSELAARSGVKSELPRLKPKISAMTLDRMSGNPALLIEWGFDWVRTPVFTLHSPNDLALIHGPIPFDSDTTGAGLVAERYLVVSRMASGEARNSIVTFDLTASGTTPLGEAGFGRYETYGFHDISEPGRPRCLFGLRDFEAATEQQYRLVTLDLPVGTMRTHATFPNIGRIVSAPLLPLPS
jgi:hypothetical protein